MRVTMSRAGRKETGSHKYCERSGKSSQTILSINSCKPGKGLEKLNQSDAAGGCAPKNIGHSGGFVENE